MNLFRTTKRGWFIAGACIAVLGLAAFFAQLGLCKGVWLCAASSTVAWLSSYGVEVLAIALSPLIALRISADIERKRDEENRQLALARDEQARKLQILATLMATRHSPYADDRIRALNTIDVLFPNDMTVRDARRELMASLSKTPKTSPSGAPDSELFDEWNERQWDLVSAIARVLKVPMTKEDFASGYAPKALQEMMGQQQLAAEVNKSLIMFARKDLGLKWNPAALYQMPPNVGITGPYQPPPEEKSCTATRK